MNITRVEYLLNLGEVALAFSACGAGGAYLVFLLRHKSSLQEEKDMKVDRERRERVTATYLDKAAQQALGSQPAGTHPLYPTSPQGFHVPAGSLPTPPDGAVVRKGRHFDITASPLVNRILLPHIDPTNKAGISSTEITSQELTTTDVQWLMWSNGALATDETAMQRTVDEQDEWDEDQLKQIRQAAREQVAGIKEYAEEVAS